jgi:hypothetical protein
MVMMMMNMICLFILVLIFSSTKQFDLGNEENYFQKELNFIFFCVKKKLVDLRWELKQEKY